MNNQTPPERYCENCGELLTFVSHWEVDGTEQGSWEPFFDCPEGCMYPTVPDSELTPEELSYRSKVDTCTEFDIVTLSEINKLSIIL